MAYGQSMVTTLLIVVTLLNTSFKLEARHDPTDTTEPQLLNMYNWNYIPFPTASNMYHLNHQQPPRLAATTGDSPPSLYVIYPKDPPITGRHRPILPRPPQPRLLPSLPYPRPRVPQPGWPRSTWPPPLPNHGFYFERN
ncbi:hypothetical protein HN51_037617 [Arachis hypogaea]|nr:uncharacterized protein DS421_13g430230 [Arachis hypogaea]